MFIEPPLIKNLNLVSDSYELGQQLLRERPDSTRKQHGQYLTPPPAARFMVEQLGPICDGDRILDPALGSGTLLCAVIESLIEAGRPIEIWLDGYEIDLELYELAVENINRAAEMAAAHHIIIHLRLYHADFITEAMQAIQPSLFEMASLQYQKVLVNPPYYKLNTNDPRAKAIKSYSKGSTNIYTVFIALAAEMLSPKGRAAFLVPRSFCSGTYFARFRREFLKEVTPISVHLFNSRQANFKQDSVLQENIIFTFSRHSSSVSSRQGVEISVSASTHDLAERRCHPTSLKNFVGVQNGNLFFRLPTNEIDEQLIEIMDSWTHHLADYNLAVSTGPVVAFRSKSYLRNTSNADAVPLLWLQNIQPQRIQWPLTKSKPQWIQVTEDSKSLILPPANYVILRRFSAKEEARRLIAAPFFVDQWQHQSIGLENHLNFIHRRGGEIATEEAIGLAAYYNSGLADRYFRLINGNTQVNATELRALPLPPLETIIEIGRLANREPTPSARENLVIEVLKRAKSLPDNFPTLLETR